MTNRNPKTFTLSQLQGRWDKEQQILEMERIKEEQRKYAGEFRGKQLTKLAMKRGKKFYVKNVDGGFTQLSLSN